MLKIGKVGLLVLTLLVLNCSTSSAWFGNKHKSGRNSILPGEATSSSSSSVLNRAGSSIVFPVHGNVYPVGFYNVTLNIGQPPKPYFLDLDTGSDLTWLQCDAPCSHCSETPHPLYQPSNDLVPCNDPLCAALHPTNDYNCDYPDQCHYEIEYADQYSTLGVLVKDVYHLNFTNGKQLKVRMGLGCGYDQVFPPYSYHPVDGLLGLGRGKVSLISQLSSQGLLQNVVGHCLSTYGGGYMFFGDVYDSFRVTWTPMSSREFKHYSAGAAELLFGGKVTGVGNLLAIFDTGSSYTYFNFQAYQALISWLKKELHGKPLLEAPDDQTVPLCWHGRRPIRSIHEVRKYFKPLALSFTNGRRAKALFEIPPEAYLIISNKGNVCLGILNPDSYAFINVIEVVSMPDYLYYTKPGDLGVNLVGYTTPLSVQNNFALEQRYRLNVGGPSIPASRDTGMLRYWENDRNYGEGIIYEPIDFVYAMLNFSKIPNYTAPDQVYRTERSIGPNKTYNVNSNLTWVFPVDLALPTC